MDFWEDEEDQEVEQQRERARASAREEIAAAWRYCFGRQPTPVIVNELANRATGLGFAPGILERAIHAAAMREANSPVDYILTLLADWHRNKVETTLDADEYAYLHDARQGKLGGWEAMTADDRIREFREDRETPEERAKRIADEQRRKAEDEQRRALILANQEARKAEQAAGGSA